MRRCIFIFSCLFLANALNGQAVSEYAPLLFRVHGSIVIAAKCSDGIILAADSRLYYQAPPPDNTILGYQDGIPKIFILKKFVLAVAGDMSDGQTRIQKIVDDFTKSNPSYNTPDECLYKFGLFVQQKYPVYFKLLNKNILIAAGFAPGASIAVLMHNETFVLSDKNWTSNFAAQIDSLQLFNFPAGTNCKRAAESAETAMKKYIQIYHKENEMGGLISVLKIRPNNSTTWLQNDFTGNGFATECEASKAFYNKKIRFTYTQPANKKLMDSLNNLIWYKCITK